jgi:hypothetical protein
MRQATPQLRDLTRRLFAYQITRSPGPADLAEVMEGLCQQLRQRLDPLIGDGGFTALLKRAVKLANQEFAWLQPDSIGDDPGCSLKALADAAARGRSGKEARASLELVFANVVWLLVTFIGEDLVLRLAQEIWPEVAIELTGADSEKRKK